MNGARLEPGESSAADLDGRLADELYHLAEAALCGVAPAEFCAALERVGAKYTYGLPAGQTADVGTREAFYRGLSWASWPWLKAAPWAAGWLGSGF